MTPETKRALERLPNPFAESELRRIEAAVCLRCENLEQAHAWTQLAARSPRFLKTLDRVVAAVCAYDDAKRPAKAEIETEYVAAIEAAETLLRETARAMLGGNA